MTDINILALFGIDITDLEEYEQTDFNEDCVTFRIRKAKADEPCGVCGCFGLTVKDYMRKLYRFRSQTGIEVRIIFDHRRYRCPHCGKCFFEPNPFVRKGGKMLSKAKILEVINYLRDGLPNTIVAKYSFVSESTVSRILDKAVQPKRKSLTEVICVDEFSSMNSTIETKYACIFLNGESHELIDVLPS